MAADQLLALAHGMNFLSLPDALKQAHCNLQAIMCKPSDRPILFWLIGLNWPIKCIMKSNTRLPYGPALFEASRMAADQLLALAHRMKFLSLPDALELAHCNLQSITCKCSDGPILFCLIGSNWPIRCIIRSNTRLPYMLTLFEASRMAANQLHALAHRMNLLSLPNALELTHSNLQAIICKPLDRPNLF